MAAIDIAPYIPAFADMSKVDYGWPKRQVEPTYSNLEYGIYNDTSLLIDLYLPDSEPEALSGYPLIVFLHGGGWMTGSKELIEPSALLLLESGYALASIDYSLSSEAQWPVQGQQVKGAVRWLRAHADDYSLDTDAFVAFGGSAGGHLASFLTTTNGMRVFDSEAYGNLDQSSDVQAGVALYPITDLTHKQSFSIVTATIGNQNLSFSGFSKFLGGSPDDNVEAAKFASPYHLVSKESAAPLLLLHGNNDKIVPVEHSQKLQARMASMSLDSEFYELDGLSHVDIRFADDTVMDKVFVFLARTLK